MKLVELPPELLLVLCQRLDLCSLGRLQQTSRLFNSLILNNTESVHRLVCFPELAAEMTSSNGAPIHLAPTQQTPSSVCALGGLARVIAGQKSQSGIFRGVAEWKAFGTSTTLRPREFEH